MNFCNNFQNANDRSNDITRSLLQRYHQYPLKNTSRNERNRSTWDQYITNHPLDKINPIHIL